MPVDSSQPSAPNDHTSTSNDRGSSRQTGYSDAPIGSGGNSARFFGWLRSLGIVRHNGWIGGVCGGVAARIGIDPIIVRGIAVVVAILGGPAFLLYAAAWLLLPDAQGDIHMERLIKGHFDPAVIGIIVLAVFTFLPFAQGFWWAGAQFWSGLSWFASLGRVLWGLLVIALIIAFVVWAARSGRIPPSPPQQPGSNGPGSGGPGTGGPAYGGGGAAYGPGPTASPFGAPASTPSTSPTDAGGGAANSGAASAAPASTLAEASTDASTPASVEASAGPVEGGSADIPAATSAAQQTPAPDTTAGAAPQDDLSDWRARQDAWRADYAAWNTQQADARAIRQQRSAEMRAQAQALTAEAEEARRLRRAANPRTSAAYMFIALGVALVAGGLAAGIALVGDAADFTLPIALATATCAAGLSIVLAGILRRRSGFLTFVSILLIIATFGALLPPRGHSLVLWPSTSYRDASAVSIFQPIGSTELSYESSGSYTAEIAQTAGSVTVFLLAGQSARVDVRQANDAGSSVYAQRVDTNGETHRVDASATDGTDHEHVFVFGSTAPDVNVRVDQQVGSVSIQYVDAG